MGARHIPCGPYANESERKAAEHLLARLNGTGQNSRWVLLTNLSSSSGAQWLPDELDLVAVGSTGVHLVEVKHWDLLDLRNRVGHAVEGEAQKLNAKAKRLKGRISRSCSFPLPFVAGKLLLTKGESSRRGDADERLHIQGIPVYRLTEWRELFELDGASVLTDDQVDAICRALEPAVQPALTGDIRTFGPFFDLERLSPVEDAFHRVYRGRRRPGRDPVLLHLYDLSATTERNAEDLARREFAAMQRLQKCPWLPNLMDSFQDAPAYPGELYFFSYVDAESASLVARSRDDTWPFAARLHFGLRCIEALTALHQPESDGEPILHRNLTPESIRVRSRSGEPLFTQLQFARLADNATISGAISSDFEGRKPYVAPEVRAGGLAASTVASDIHALCASLAPVFTESPDEHTLADAARRVLEAGCSEGPARRPSLAELHARLSEVAQPSAPAAGENVELDVQYWDEETVRLFRDYHYRIVSRLGSGGVGTTFRVMQVDLSGTTELSGPFVAKVITREAVGETAARAYNRVRAQTGGPHLAGVLEVAPRWRPNQITALLKWIEGSPLSEYAGILPLYLEEQGLAGDDVEATLIQWARDLCEGLLQLHRAGLVHGDVSPKNIIVSGSTVTLTDFDLSTESGAVPPGGHPQYCAPAVDSRRVITPSDDLFALAGTLFHVFFDRAPFQFPLGLEKERGLNWAGLDRNAWPRLAPFMDRAVHPDPERRFQSAEDALGFLDGMTAPGLEQEGTSVPYPLPVLQENEEPWLAQLLQSYPASRKGNAETRGLDSEFARDTYVETELDEQLADDIRARKVSLVILCGNAGDGKTAFLQNLARRLDTEPGPSAKRLWELTLSDGLRVYANLDGSAAYQGRSDRELLDEFFAPFRDGEFPSNLVHLLAINDGPLLAWLEQQEETPLTAHLSEALKQEGAVAEQGRIRFINLNARSLVGSLVPGQAKPVTDFLDRLLDKLLGEAENHWRPCETCTAQSRCTAWRSVRTLRDPELGLLLRQRLARALQAVHHRGEVHITARELRAALGYLFFGVHACTDLHRNPSLEPPHYWDRVFDIATESRQGELLTELSLLDPGLDSHPRLDRHLLLEADGLGERGAGVAGRLRSLRRRAYFEWPEIRIREVGDSETALDLDRGRHLSDFQRVATGTDADRREICARLCGGIARMEDLPPKAFDAGYPLKITPRTPTETAFWVSKPIERFSLRAPTPPAASGLETLHTHVILTYRFENGQSEELRVGAALFDLLMEIRDGYQVCDLQSDEVFAHLSIFKQRLAQEGHRSLYACNPLDERVFQIRAEMIDGMQKLVIAAEGDAR